MLLLLLNKMWSLSSTERVGHELSLECLSCLRQWQDIAFLLVNHTFEAFFIFKWIQYILSQRYIKNGTEVGWSCNTTVQNLHL